MNSDLAVNLRERRAAAARLLQASSRRAPLAWSDLAAWPHWAALAPEALEPLAFAVGAWGHAANVRRCIDGRLLKRLRERLGEAQMCALLAHDGGELDADAIVAAEARLHEHTVLCTGRDALLATVESPALREALRERLWPDAGPALRVIPRQAATELVRRASEHLQP